MSRIFVTLAILLFGIRAYGIECKEYQPSVENDITAAKNLVFFASWCQSCVHSINKSNSSLDLYIAAFDDKEKAESALAFVLKEEAENAKCIWDKSGEIAKRFDVTNLPRIVENNK